MARGVSVRTIVRVTDGAWIRGARVPALLLVATGVSTSTSICTSNGNGATLLGFDFGLLL
jgi:hypothetical protein